MMFFKSSTSPDAPLASLDDALAKLRGGGSVAQVVLRVRADVAALRFHLSNRSTETPVLLVILGGTGTGKSTLVNRLLGANVTASSFRRTFTAGCVAVAEERFHLPEKWLNVEHVPLGPDQLPAKGKPDELVIALSPLASSVGVVLVDTPDLDGDTPAHHAQADRAFRWATAVLFLVSPEKYQMTELLPYYRLATRYGTPSLFVMNKCESEEMRSDYAALVVQQTTQADTSAVYAVARNDAAYEPPVESNLESLRRAIVALRPAAGAARDAGVSNRVEDLLGRLNDQIITPLRRLRREIDRMTTILHELETAPPGVDVNPVTQQLRRRLQQRSVLYLIGPGKVIDRVRQVPGLLLRLPRYAWDLAARGKAPAVPTGEAAALAADAGVPDFSALLADQFAIVQSRVDDVLRSGPEGEKLIVQSEESYASSKIDPASAGAIADQELGDLREWLEKRWNATPRDTALLMKLLKYLPGGDKLTRWSEAAPYLLTIVVATHHAFFGHVDLIVLGGYGLAAWLTERISNEVASRTRQTNRRIQTRFERLAHDQIERTTRWLNDQVPTTEMLDKLEKLAERIREG